MVCSLSYLVVDKRGVPGAYCVLFEGIGISFPGVHSSAVAFRRCPDMCKQ